MPVYNKAKKKLLDGDFALLSNTLKVALLSSAYTPNYDTHEFFSDVSANEVAGTGYSAGGATLANKTSTVDTVNDLAAFDADDVVWDAAGGVLGPARYAVVYKDTGNPATSPVLALLDFGSNKTATNTTFTIQWGASGALKFL